MAPQLPTFIPEHCASTFKTANLSLGTWGRATDKRLHKKMLRRSGVLLLMAGVADGLLISPPAVPAQKKFERLLADMSAYKNMPLRTAKTFPPGAYTVPEIFDLEADNIFRPGWMCVAHVSQLRNKGDYTTVDLLGELMMVVNDGDNIRVLSRICTHRWAPVVDDKCGTCKKFTCPFHRWSFELDGSCSSTPLMEVDKKDRPLPEYNSQIVGGFVFVNIDGTSEPLELGEMTDYLDNWETEMLENYIEIEYDCAFNWKIVVETFMECYHHMGAHSTTFEPNFPAKLSWTEDARSQWTLGHAAPRPGRETEAFDLGLPHFPKLSTKERQAFALFNVFPAHLLHAMPDRLLWFRLQPLSADRTIVTTTALVHPNTLNMPDFQKVQTEQAKIMDEINKEDIAVNTMQQVGAKSGTVEPGSLNPSLEKALWQLNTFVAGKICKD